MGAFQFDLGKKANMPVCKVHCQVSPEGDSVLVMLKVLKADKHVTKKTVASCNPLPPGEVQTKVDSLKSIQTDQVAAAVLTDRACVWMTSYLTATPHNNTVRAISAQLY